MFDNCAEPLFRDAQSTCREIVLLICFRKRCLPFWTVFHIQYAQELYTDTHTHAHVQSLHSHALNNRTGGGFQTAQTRK